MTVITQATFTQQYAEKNGQSRTVTPLRKINSQRLSCLLRKRNHASPFLFACRRALSLVSRLWPRNIRTDAESMCHGGISKDIAPIFDPAKRKVVSHTLLDFFLTTLSISVTRKRQRYTGKSGVRVLRCVPFSTARCGKRLSGERAQRRMECTIHHGGETLQPFHSLAPGFKTTMSCLTKRVDLAT